MKKKQLLLNTVVALGVTMLLTCGLAAQTVSPAADSSANMVVTEQTRQGSEAPNLQAQEVNVYQGHERDQVTRFVPAQGANGGLELFILLDDDSNVMLGTQLRDIRNFIMEQPAAAKIGVAYMRNGVARVAQAPTNDHNLAAKALRLTLSESGINGSPYIALSNLVKHWPVTQGRREVLMISDGVDSYYEQADLFDPYLAKAIADTQRAGVVVSTIYTPGAGTSSRSSWGTYWGQTYLAHVAKETGGQAYYIGFNRPAVSFAPFLDDLAKRLNHQYLLSFQTGSEKRGGLEPVKVTTTEPDTELVAAESVFVPGNR